MGNKVAMHRMNKEQANKHKEQIKRLDIDEARRKDEAAQKDKLAELEYELATRKQQDEHQAALNKIEADKEVAKAQLANDKAAQEAKEKERQDEYEKFLKELEHKKKQEKIDQTQERVGSMKEEIAAWDDKIQSAAAELEDKKMALERQIKEQENQKDKIDAFPSVKADALAKKKIELQLPKAEREFNEADDQIKAAINKTGQVEENVGKFLTLTHGLLGGALRTTANATKLSVQLATFGEMVSKECQDKLTIQQYFTDQDLNKFIPILAQEGFESMENLKCSDDGEYEEILQIVEQGVKERMEEEKAKNENDEDEKDEAEKEDESGEGLLTKWGLADYWDAMKDEGWEDVNDWKELTEDDLKEMGFKGGHIKKFNRQYKAYLDDKCSAGKKKSVLSKREQRVLKQICMQPETWREYAELQQKAVREGLGEICPLMSEFFKRIHHGLEQCGQMLGFDENLNADQLKAIEQISSAPPRSIEYKIDEEENKDEDEKDEEEKEQGTAEGPEDVDDAKEEPRHNRMRTMVRQSTKNDISEQKEEKIEKEQSEKPRKNQSVEDYAEDPEEAIHKEWNIGTKVQIYSISNKRWMDGEIVSIDKDDEGEWLDVKYGNQTKQVGRYSDVVRAVMNAENKVALQSRQLTAAAIVSIDVTKSMIKEFSQNVLTERALVVATGVEDSSMQVVKSQGAIRQSLLMAQEILKLRPAHISDEGKKLWDAVDDGVVRIMKNALTMVAVSSEYFGFFLKFQHGFKYYQSNTDKPLMIGLKFLHQDIEQFNAFKDKFAKTVQELSDEAMDCIRKCVSSTIGAENFERFRKSRQERLDNYLDKKREYDAEAKRLDDELEKLKNVQVWDSGTRVKLEAVVQNLENAIKNNQNQKEKCLEIKNELEQMLTKLVAE